MYVYIYIYIFNQQVAGLIILFKAPLSRAISALTFPRNPHGTSAASDQQIFGARATESTVQGLEGRQILLGSEDLSRSPLKTLRNQFYP